MTADQLTAILAERVMGWAAAPDRFLTSNRHWIPRWRFQPLTKVEDAFQLLEHVATAYTLTASRPGMFAAEVRIHASIGHASCESNATAITVAVARAVGFDVPGEIVVEKKR
jgi:hypothetical protein